MIQDEMLQVATGVQEIEKEGLWKEEGFSECPSIGTYKREF
jgi:hypothetical protein